MCWSERMTECDVIVRQHGNRTSVTKRHACMLVLIEIGRLGQRQRYSGLSARHRVSDDAVCGIGGLTINIKHSTVSNFKIRPKCPPARARISLASCITRRGLDLLHTLLNLDGSHGRRRATSPQIQWIVR